MKPGLPVIVSLMLAFPAMVLAAENIEPPPSVAKPQAGKQKAVKQSDVPSLPEELENDSRNLPEPEVRIIKRKDATIEEYRVKGKIRYIKIRPVKGPAYYMFDSNGDGQVDTREDDLANPPINRWILMEW